jgi:exopolysaccharide biosynthesis polyprenyl glycosylphosphotransferase
LKFPTGSPGFLSSSTFDPSRTRWRDSARDPFKAGAVGLAAVGDIPALQTYVAALRSSGMTLQAIADRLNAEGVPTLAGAQRWRPSGVQAAVGYHRPPPRPAQRHRDGERADLSGGAPVSRSGELRHRRSATAAVPEGVPDADVLRRDALYRRVLAAADLFSSALALYIAVVLIAGEQLAVGAVLAAPLVVVLNKLVGLYDRDEHLLLKTTLEEVPTIFAVATLFTLLIWIFDGVTVASPLRHGQVVAVWGLAFMLMVAGRGVARGAARWFAPEERCLVVGDEESAEEMCRKLELSFSSRARVVGRVPLERDLESRELLGDGVHADGHAESEQSKRNARRCLPTLGTLELLGLALIENDIHRVIVTPGSSETDETLDAIRVVKSLGVKVSVRPRMFEVVGSSVDFDDVDGVMLLGLHPSRLSRSSSIVKRGIDIVGSLSALVLLSPVLVAAAAAIKLSSPGPVLFRQKRIGRHGVEFDLLKFRSMTDGADTHKENLLTLNETKGLFKLANDPRVTPVGRFLRRRSLDELPQLWNVLRGQMSLVGPRPLVPEEDARIEGWERDRLALVPGMTGVWQILGSTRVPLHEMVKIDYLYTANWSLWTDVKIILRTALYVIRAGSA